MALMGPVEHHQAEQPPGGPWSAPPKSMPHLCPGQRCLQPECIPVSDHVKRVINSSGASLCFRIDGCDQQAIQITMRIIKTLQGTGWHAEN